jgi:hypothetical protein
MMSVEDIAHAAIVGESPLASGRDDFARSEARPVAVFHGVEICAALVVRRRRDDLWITDVVVFARAEGGELDWRGEGGATWGGLPLDAEQRTDALGSFGQSMGHIDDRPWIAAYGFASTDVSAVELRVRGDIARTRPSRATGAYVVASVVETEDDMELDEADVVALGASGTLDSLQNARERRRQSPPMALTVADACALPDHSLATVRGVLLVVEGQPVVLCDEVESGKPPVAIGAVLELPGFDTSAVEPSWRPGSPVLRTSHIIITGEVIAGTLRAVPRRSTPRFED